MSSSGRNWGRWIKRFFKDDIRIIAIFLIAILTLTYGFTMMIGWAAPYGANIATPSQSSWEKNRLDSDQDSLSDIIEGTDENPCIRGEDVYDERNRFVGECTDTDPFDPDTDGDFFPDNAEDALGSNPNSPWDPGWVYIIWILAIVWFVARRFYHGDPLAEYKEFKQVESSGVSTKDGGKYAYGKGSIYSKRPSDMSEEERRQAIQNDARFQRLAYEGAQTNEEPKRRRRNYQRLAVQIAVATLIGVIIVFIGRQT